MLLVWRNSQPVSDSNNLKNGSNFSLEKRLVASQRNLRNFMEKKGKMSIKRSKKNTNSQIASGFCLGFAKEQKCKKREIMSCEQCYRSNSENVNAK